MPRSSAVCGRLWRLCLKELRETLRDRRTVVTLVLMPLLVYPLLTILFNKLQSFSQHSVGQMECIVGVESEKPGRDGSEAPVGWRTDTAPKGGRLGRFQEAGPRAASDRQEQSGRATHTVVHRQ